MPHPQEVWRAIASGVKSVCRRSSTLWQLSHSDSLRSIDMIMSGMLGRHVASLLRPDCLTSCCTNMTLIINKQTSRQMRTIREVTYLNGRGGGRGWTGWATLSTQNSDKGRRPFQYRRHEGLGDETSRRGAPRWLDRGVLIRGALVTCKLQCISHPYEGPSSCLAEGLAGASRMSIRWPSEGASGINSHVDTLVMGVSDGSEKSWWVMNRGRSW